MVCTICERRCVVAPNEIGRCDRYECKDGEMVERFPDSYLVVAPISAETMPVLHFHPRAKFLQISTTGCNFDCSGCISTVVAKTMDANSKALKKLSAMQIVMKAVELDCDGIAFLMNDPLASLHTFTEICKLAKKRGLLTGCSTNGYFTPESLRLLSPYLDFVNVGLKGLTNDVYRSCGAHSYKPVLRNIRLFIDAGVHVEVACIHKKGDDDNVLLMADAIASISREIPLQIMRFVPIDDADIAMEPSIKDSERLYTHLREKLDYVYLFNSPGTDCLNTYCPSCKSLIFVRDFYGPMGAKLRDIRLDIQGKACPQCGYILNIEGAPAQRIFTEDGFEGGYPLTRALEIVEGTLAAIGVRDQKSVSGVWEEVLSGAELKKLHLTIQNFEDYASTILHFGELSHQPQRAQRLVDYMREKIALIAEGFSQIKTRPRVYYTMGKPLFALEEDRLENQLVEMAWGISLNKGLVSQGRPGMRISVKTLNALNPDVIFISSFMDCPIDEFYEFCEQQNIDVEATKNKRIHGHIAPCFDFGSPRWILGLMHIANMLHPAIYHFDVTGEAEFFYETFYDTPFAVASINRSFAKPSMHCYGSIDNRNVQSCAAVSC